MTLQDELHAITNELLTGELFFFKNMVPQFLVNKIGIYSIWNGNLLEYIGVSENLHERLKKHRSGSRSGDKFNIHVADSRVLTSLTNEEISKISKGLIKYDEIIRKYVQSSYSFRVRYFESGGDKTITRKHLCEVETHIKNNGLTSQNIPYLNGRKKK